MRMPNPGAFAYGPLAAMATLAADATEAGRRFALHAIVAAMRAIMMKDNFVFMASRVPHVVPTGLLSPQGGRVKSNKCATFMHIVTF